MLITCSWLPHEDKCAYILRVQVLYFSEKIMNQQSSISSYLKQKERGSFNAYLERENERRRVTTSLSSTTRNSYVTALEALFHNMLPDLPWKCFHHHWKSCCTNTRQNGSYVRIKKQDGILERQNKLHYIHVYHSLLMLWLITSTIIHLAVICISWS